MQQSTLSFPTIKRSRPRSIDRASAQPPSKRYSVTNMPRFPPGIRIQPQRVGVQRYRRNKYNTRRRSKYPRPGSRSIAMRPTYGSRTALEVHRKFAENGALVTWPKLDSGLQTPSLAAVYVPYTFQNWQRGVSDSQFTGSRVTLKNISTMMQLQMPKTIPTAQNFPYRFRITHGYCKQNTVVSIKSAVGAGEDLPGGIALNQPQPDADTPWLANNDPHPPAFSTVFQNIKVREMFIGRVFFIYF
eukprot:SAG11_NODE_2509_length_3270_cov_4.938190_2_plen_244_part_00